MPILGIDEVGRGPLAGPLVVGAVILPNEEKPWFDDLADSKKLTTKKREALNTLILQDSATGLGWVSASELDKIGISNALKLATRRAVKEIQALHVPFSQIIIDGKINFLTNTPLEKYVSTIIKADSKIREVSAASIIAKVARDRFMVELSSKYPEYHFDQNVGYGTKAHTEAIFKFGLTPEHRRSFEPCKSLSDYTTNQKFHKNTTNIGKKAEQIVADYLEKQGHGIVARNHKTFFYEIDIISIKNKEIYFTEVKYRKTSSHGSGLDAITKEKLARMHFSAESYLKYQESKYKNFEPRLAVASVSAKNYQIESWFPLSE